MKILKFGGTSVQSAASMKQVLKCIEQENDRGVIVVLSALSGVTDTLLRAVNLSVTNIDLSLNICQELRQRHIELINNLIEQNSDDAQKKINNLFDDVANKLLAFNALGEITSLNIDSVQSYGEILSTTIFFEYLHQSQIKCQFLDIRKVIKTNSNFTNAEVNFEESLIEIKKNLHLFKECNIIITQGFIASDEKRRTTTFGRGGSDYTASVIGKLLKSSGFDIEEIQIWTDVDGILSADPRIISTANTIPAISPKEVRIMSYLGAKVLHPDTIKPSVSMNIQVRVKNTFKPLNDGTLITNDEVNTNQNICSIVLVGKCNLLKIQVQPEMNVWSFCGRISEIAQLGNCKPIFMEVADDELYLYFKNNPEIFFNSKMTEVIEIEECCVVALIGKSLNNSVNKINPLLIKDLNLVGISESALYLKSETEISNSKLLELYNNIFNS